MFAILYGLELVYLECNHFILSTPLLQINTCVILYIHQCGNSEPSYDSAIEKFSILIPASAPIAPSIALHPCGCCVLLRRRQNPCTERNSSRTWRSAPKTYTTTHGTTSPLSPNRFGRCNPPSTSGISSQKDVPDCCLCIQLFEGKGIKDGAIGSVCTLERHRFLGRIYTVNWYYQILNLFFSSIFALSSFPFCLIDYIFLDLCTSKQVPSAKAHLAP